MLKSLRPRARPLLRRLCGSASSAPTTPSPAATRLHGEEPALERPRAEELVLIRHGESEGNIAYNRSMDGDHSLCESNAEAPLGHSVLLQ